MIEGLKPYTDYKESGVPWLATVPSHWQTGRNGNLFQQRNDTGYPDLPVLEVSLRTGVRVRAFGASERKQVMADARKYKRTAAGDVAYNMMRMWQGAVGVSPVEGLVSPAYVVARPFVGTEARYYATLFRISSYMGEIDAASRGIVKDRNRLYWDQFKQMRSLVPPPAEQAAIVRFLDHANRKIDGFIRAKRTLIGLLNEQKHAIIHRAVTRGLNPNASLKPSSIPWLGDIPSHWAIRPIKQTLTRIDYGTSESSTAEGKFRVLTMGHIQAGRVVIPESGGINVIPDDLTLANGDLLFNRTNSPELVGKVGIYEGNDDPPITFASYLVRLRVRSEHNPHWLNYLLNSARFWAFARSQAFVSLHQANLNSTRYGRMNIPVPPRADQNEIVERIEKELAPVVTATARTEREIALMQEYRTRLTGDVITGKLDVREAAAKLPDLTDVPAPDPIESDAVEETEFAEDDS
jgi:type I restriction enzyme S subunit